MVMHRLSEEERKENEVAVDNLREMVEQRQQAIDMVISCYCGTLRANQSTDLKEWAEGLLCRLEELGWHRGTLFQTGDLTLSPHIYQRGVYSAHNTEADVFEAGKRIQLFHTREEIGGKK